MKKIFGNKFKSKGEKRALFCRVKDVFVIRMQSD